jgi:hypothetical protein
MKDELAVPLVSVEPTFDHNETDHTTDPVVLNRGIATDIANGIATLT